MSEPEGPTENALVHGHAGMGGVHRTDGWAGWRPLGPELLPSLLNQPPGKLIAQLLTPYGWPASPSESTLARNNAQRCRGEGLIHTPPALCSAIPSEGSWGPKAFETLYKGSLCGFLKLILSESPQANSVQLDYHSLPLNSAVFQCPLLNEFAILRGSCWQSIPAVKCAALPPASCTGQPTGTYRTSLCSLPRQVRPPSPTR